MKVMVIGATGAIGTRLVPQLRQAGHEVIGTSRSSDRAQRLASRGAQGVPLDVLDKSAVQTAVAAAGPDAIVYQATALADLSDYKHFDRSFAQTSRLRTEGTDNVLDAARRAGVHRIIAQSYAPVRYSRQGGPIKSEDDPLDSRPPASIRQAMGAVTYLEQAVTAAGGIALRYGTFYGDPGDKLVEAVRKGQVPLVGDGGGVWSFIHLEDADMMATEDRGASNSKAKRELGWTLRFPGWRDGFAAAYGASESLKAAA